jgi:DNA-binding response OmpR family regulator
MNRALAGRVILITEDEPQIAFEMTLAFEDEGALVLRARTLKQTLAGVGDPQLSAAVLGHALSDGETLTVCERLKKQNIPFVICSGYDQDAGAARDITGKKPVGMPALVAVVQRAISERVMLNHKLAWSSQCPPGLATTGRAVTGGLP